MKMRTLLAIVFSLVEVMTNAQTNLKIGYADVDYIFSKLPDAKQIESSLQAHQVQLQSQLKARYDEYKQKLAALNGMPADTPEAIQRDKMNELAQLEQRIQEFQQSAQESMENKRVQLLEPVYTKVGNAIKAVAEENKFDFILTAGVGGTDIVLYAGEEHDVSELVLKKLGVTATK